MRIGRLIGQRGIIFEGTIAKILLNRELINHYIENFYRLTEWQEKGCQLCTDESKCKKHRAFDTLMQAENCIKVINVHPTADLCISGNLIYTYNSTNDTLLVIDTPPFNVRTEIVNDTWIRKLIPFTFGNLGGFQTPKIVKILDIDEFYRYPVLTVRFGYQKDNDRLLELHNVNRKTFHWSITEYVPQPQQGSQQNAEAA